MAQPGQLGLKSYCLLLAMLLGILLALPIIFYRLERRTLSPGHGVSIPTTLQGRTALVTGSSAGIGLHAAEELYRLGAHVLLTGRNAEKTRAAAKQITQGHPQQSTTVLTLDLTDFRDVRRFARELCCSTARMKQRRQVLATLPFLDIVLLKAGMSYGKARPKNTTGPSGYDILYSANFMGHFLLMSLLREHLAPGAAVALVGSAQMWAGRTPQLTPGPAKARAWQPGAYPNSKLAGHCFALALRRRLKSKATVVDFVPGYVDTAIHGFEDPRCSRRFKSWCAPADRAGLLAVQSLFVSAWPPPDTVYAMWFPRRMYAQYAGMRKENWRWDHQGLFQKPTQLMRLTWGTLHAGPGPDCSVKAQEALWNWAAENTGAPAKW